MDLFERDIKNILNDFLDSLEERVRNLKEQKEKYKNHKTTKEALRNNIEKTKADISRIEEKLNQLK